MGELALTYLNMKIDNLKARLAASEERADAFNRECDQLAEKNQNYYAEIVELKKTATETKKAFVEQNNCAVAAEIISNNVIALIEHWGSTNVETAEQLAVKLAEANKEIETWKQNADEQHREISALKGDRSRLIDRLYAAEINKPSVMCGTDQAKQVPQGTAARGVRHSDSYRG